MSEPVAGPWQPPRTGASLPSLRPNRVEPDPAAVDVRPYRWTRVEAADAGGSVLDVHFTLAGPVTRAVLGHVTVAETSTDVTITLGVGRPAAATPDDTGPVPMLAAEMVTSVQLARPLGARPVRDGAVGA